MPAQYFSERETELGRDWGGSARRLVPILVTVGILLLGWTIALKITRPSFLSVHATEWVNEDNLDQRLELAATKALGDRRGTIIIMDPQSGRIRVVVHPKVAFEENLPPGSTLKPFTALAAMRSGLIDDQSNTLCREEYSHDEFHTVCSHPRDLPPLNPTEAIAYSCNYYFGRVGERMSEPNFVSTLSEFGFGRRTGLNVDLESPGKLLRNGWQPEKAMGEGDSVQATPIQVLTAYSALVNGGHLFVPRLAPAKNFAARVQSDLTIKDEQRALIIKGMRGAVRYGTAETANLHSIPNYIFGKTGTATQINGFRSQGWFVGFAASNSNEVSAEVSPAGVKLAVLVFLAKAHGSEAAELARPIFDEYARLAPVTGEEMETSAANETANVPSSSRNSLPKAAVRVHLVSESITQTMSLEDYVRGVVATEGSTEREPEALKALAIASRTFAIKNLNRHAEDGYDFCSTTHCQRYRAVDPNVSSATASAVEVTEGEVLLDAGNRVADSYFSASCGGATANIATLWGGSAPLHLRGIEDEFCVNEPHHTWTNVISHAQLLKALQSDPRTNVGSQLNDVSVLKRDVSGRAELIAIQGDRRRTVKGWDFKIIVGRALGWNLLKSSRFAITRSGSDFVFQGSGFGHGLGLCQQGAHVMAIRGAGYRQILDRYFPGTRITTDSKPAATDVAWAETPGMNIPAAFPTRGRVISLRQTLTSEDFRINYPASINRREVETLLSFLQSSRHSLSQRIASAGLTARLPALEVFINETTGDFVGRTGQPPWVAAATKGNRIELQPLQTLKRRRILETTLRHELVHNFVDALGRGRTPRWLAEGLAIHVAGEAPLVARFQPRSRMAIEEIEKRLGQTTSAADMKLVYAAAYGEVKRLIANEGEANVWRRVGR